VRFPKKKPIRLKGKKLHDLYKRVYERDRGRCVKCGYPIPEGTIPHHIIHKSQGGEDTEENLEMLCEIKWDENGNILPGCHRKEHTGGI